MSYEDGAQHACEAMGFGQNGVAFFFRGAKAGIGLEIKEWAAPTGPPTEQEVAAVLADATPLPSGQLFSAWLAEHGGDPVTTRRRLAREAVDALTPESMARRAYGAAIHESTGIETERELRDRAKAIIDEGRVG